MGQGSLNINLGDRIQKLQSRRANDYQGCQYHRRKRQYRWSLISTIAPPTTTTEFRKIEAGLGPSIASSSQRWAEIEHIYPWVQQSKLNPSVADVESRLLFQPTLYKSGNQTSRMVCQHTTPISGVSLLSKRLRCYQCECKTLPANKLIG